MIGQIAAGSPSEWVPIEKWRTIRPLRDVKAQEEMYGMEVVGDSLIDYKIHNGDVLIYVAKRAYKPGDLCVVQTPHGITAKFVHYRKAKDEMILKAANPSVKDQSWHYTEVVILGVVKRVERDL